MSKRPWLIAHRGGAGLFPENTLMAFHKSINNYHVDCLELDIHASNDGVLVVIHDETVDRTTNGSGKVGELTLEQLKRLDAGWHFTLDEGRTFPLRGKGLTIPTLKEVFEGFRKVDVKINIEVKTRYPNIENKLYNLITGMGMEKRVLITAGHPCLLNHFRKINKRGIATGAHALESFSAYLLSKLHLGELFHPKYDALQVPYVFRGMIQVVSKNLVTMCKTKNIPLHVWTINDMETMKKLLDMGVDGIITDYPNRLYKMFQEYGYR